MTPPYKWMNKILEFDRVYCLAPEEASNAVYKKFQIGT